MVFDISFLEDSAKNQTLCRGRIRIVDFTEIFEAPLDFWKRAEYEAQWRDGVRRILEERADSCIITSITNPSSANFLFWWPMYLDGTTVVFQNQVLFLDQCVPEFSVDRPWLSLQPRQTTSEDGAKISEWRIDVTRLLDWLNNLEDSDSGRVAPG